MTKQWKSIPGFEGLYEASDTGLIRSWAPAPALPVPRPLAPSTSRQGYLRVTLYRNGERHYRYVHMAVLAAFVGPRPPGMVVRHLNGDQLDNRTANLAYGTVEENAQDIVRHGRHPHANKTHCVRGHEYDTRNTRREKAGSRTCRSCAAILQMERRRKLGVEPRKPLEHIEHGTRRGYRAHVRLGQLVPSDDACGCRSALRAHNKAASARRRTVTAPGRLST